MNAGGAGQGGQGDGSGAGAGSGGQNNGQETTTTSAQQQQTTANGFITTTANPHYQTTTATNSPTSTSTSSSSASSGNQKAALIGGVAGGIAGLLIISLIAIWFLNRRQKRRIAEKRGSAKPVTYADLNSSFAGVPFGRSNRSSQHDSLLPPPPLLTPTTGPSTPHDRIGLRGGGHDSNTEVDRDSGDYFLPTYAESQASMSLAGPRALGRLNTSNSGPGSVATISPMSVHHPGGTPTTVGGISPQTTGGEIPMMLPQHTRDTMGFPVDGSDIGIHRTSTPGPSILAPVPRHPLVQQENLERLVNGRSEGTHGMQDPNLLGPRNGPAGRVMSQELMSESPVLGQMHPVRMQGTAGPSNLGVQRFESQRTVSSVSSMGISVVSDTELERLGVGSTQERRRFQ